MAYRLRLDERIPDGLKRVALEQIADGIARLEFGEDPHEAVHEARKDCKKVRAVLRLARDAMGESAFQRENARYRDAARRISDLRDSHAMLEKLGEFSGDFALDEAVLARVQGTLVERRDAMLGEARSEGLLQQVAASLREAEAGIPDWPIRGKGFAALGPGLGRVYKRGRKGFRAARKTPDAQTVHDWRKRVKYLWYQTRLLRPAWPEVLKPYASQLHSLADCLGEAHDLVVMQEILLQPDLVAPDSPEGCTLRGAIEKRRARCHKKAWPLAGRIFAEPRTAFVRRMGLYWQTAARNKA